MLVSRAVQHDGRMERRTLLSGNKFSRAWASIWDNEPSIPPSTPSRLSPSWPLFISGAAHFMVFTRALFVKEIVKVANNVGPPQGHPNFSGVASRNRKKPFITRFGHRLPNRKWGISCIGQCSPFSQFSRLFHFLWSTCGQTRYTFITSSTGLFLRFAEEAFHKLG